MSPLGECQVRVLPGMRIYVDAPELVVDISDAHRADLE